MNIVELERSLWTTADKLRANMDAAEYKHIVIGLIFLIYKYLSKSFTAYGEPVEPLTASTSTSSV